MTRQALEAELEINARRLPELKSAEETAYRAVREARAVLDDLDEGLYYGRVCGALRTAIRDLRDAEEIKDRAVSALAQHCRRRQ